MLRRAWPDEVGKQLKVLREAASRDAPRPQKGRTRLMMVVGVGAGQTAATVGKRVAEACALTPRAAAKGLAAGSFVAVSRDAQKNLLLWLRVRPCAHHKLASAVWLELDAAEGSDLKTMQATILDLFNNQDEYTVKELLNRTGMPQKNYNGALLQLCNPRFKVLKKEIREARLDPNEKITVNLAFANKNFRVNVMPVSTKDQRKQNDDDEVKRNVEGVMKARN